MIDKHLTNNDRGSTNVEQFILFSFIFFAFFCLVYPAFTGSSDNHLPKPFPVADVESISVSPDGSFVLCAGNRLTLYNLEGKVMWSEPLPDHFGKVVNRMNTTGW